MAEFDEDAGIVPKTNAGADEAEPELEVDVGAPNNVGACGADADSAGFFGTSF